MQGTQDWRQIRQDAAPSASDPTYIFADVLEVFRERNCHLVITLNPSNFLLML